MIHLIYVRLICPGLSADNGDLKAAGLCCAPLFILFAPEEDAGWCRGGAGTKASIFGPESVQDESVLRDCNRPLSQDELLPRPILTHSLFERRPSVCLTLRWRQSVDSQSALLYIVPPPPTPLHRFHMPSPSSTTPVRSTLACMKQEADCSPYFFGR